MARVRIRRRSQREFAFPHARTVWAAIVVVLGIVLLLGSIAEPVTRVLGPPGFGSGLIIVTVLAVAGWLIWPEISGKLRLRR